MALPANLVRRRAAQGIVLIIAVAGAPFVADAMWPEGAKYLPPSLLTILVLLSVANALLVWRSDWVFKALFQDHSPPVALAKVTHGHRIAAAVGLLLSAFLCVLWVRSLV